jgi:hypothetical protein
LRFGEDGGRRGAGPERHKQAPRAENQEHAFHYTLL